MEDQLPVVHDRKIQLASLQLLCGKDGLLDCLLLGDGLRKEICADLQPGGLCIPVILLEFVICLDRAGIDTVAAVADAQHDEVDAVLFDAVPVGNDIVR